MKIFEVATEDVLEVEKLHMQELSIQQDGTEDSIIAEVKDTEDLLEGDDEEIEDDEETVAVEAINTLYGPTSPSTENYLTEHALPATMGYLVTFLKLLTKTTAIAAVKIVKNTAKMSFLLGTFIKRKQNSYSKQLVRIRKLQTALGLITAPVDLSDFKFSRSNVISVLASSGGITESIQEVNQFVSAMQPALTKSSKEVGRGITATIQTYTSETNKDFASLLTDTKAPKDLLASNTIREYDSPGTESFQYVRPLPGGYSFVMILPKSGFTDISEAAPAYQSSKAIMSPGLTDEVSDIPYKDVAELGEFLGELEKLCLLGEQLNQDYTNVMTDKLSMRRTLGVYIKALATSSDSSKIKTNLVRHVYLRLMLTDKVYLAGSMTVHDYTSKVLTNGLIYARDNVSRLS